MDQEPSEVREGVAAPPEEGDAERGPEEIRADIEETREELGETVEALAEKADVKSRARAKVDEVKETVSAKKDEAAASAPDGASAGARQVAQAAQQNPQPFAVGGALVAGFLLGRITKR